MLNIKKLSSILSSLVLVAMLFAIPFTTTGVQAASIEDVNEKIIQVLIVENGNSTILTGEEADRFIKDKEAEWEEIESQKESYAKNNALDSKISESSNMIEPKMVKWYYKYNESGNNNSIHRTSLKRRITNIYKNTSSETQEVDISWSISESWSINSEITGEFLKAVKSTLGSSWAKSYSQSKTITMKVKPNKQTMYLEFYPIMKNSWSYSEKWCKSIGSGGLDMCFEKKWVDTYSPRYVYNSDMKVKTVDGVYICVEKSI